MRTIHAKLLIKFVILTDWQVFYRENKRPLKLMFALILTVDMSLQDLLMPLVVFC
ncbi:hypothetical protein U0Q88_013435 [Lactiplantibacillus plantarum]